MDSSDNEYSTNTSNGTSKRCGYCTRRINSVDDCLECQQCQVNVHIKCLRHASTPGDLLGDVFFDFTCSQCNDGPSTAAALSSPELLVRQKLPWLIVITLALYNLSLKSKGLSHHGYFHWRTHIVSFIDKNWDFLFDPMTRRRKKWIGSVSGALSHNSPEFFLSGQEVFQESGWWKLTHSNQTPKFIYALYEQQLQKRQQLRNDKRLLDDVKHTPESSTSQVATTSNDAKRLRRIESEEDLVVTDSCSRTIPYMGRKPKLAKQLNIVDVDINKSLQSEQPQQSLSTVQSSLMDFLAENLASEDLMFQDLPNIAPEPIVGLGKHDDEFLPLLTANELQHHKHMESSFFEMAHIKQESSETVAANSFHVGATDDDVDGKLKSFYLYQQQQEREQQQPQQPQQQLHQEQHVMQQHLMNAFANDECPSENIIANNSKQIHENNAEEDYKNNEDEDGGGAEQDDGDEEDEAYQPRIVQVTNFQQIKVEASTTTATTTKTATKLKQIKQETQSDAEPSDYEDVQQQSGGSIKNIAGYVVDDEDDDAKSTASESNNNMAPCKPSLFTKRKQQRELPWLRNNVPDDEEEEIVAEENNGGGNDSENIVMMSEYEEKELLLKLRKIFALETKCNISIPTYVRRFYRKLCVRAWKREHSRPLFNLDDYCDATRNSTAQRIHARGAVTPLIDRYQLLSLSNTDARSSFYARIAGSFQYELFESPYTQRVLHPFIYRNKKCFPPRLKLMCELQWAVNGTPPHRASIDFCYVRPNHIAAVNALLQASFWPGIDMSECLSYPDFSVVALYKKLVVGCGFLVPDVGFNEAYISFMAVRPDWQRSGIATFMLYHLIQTCMSKDITLHVSATNPAVVLYQKFGFKIEQVILDFYEKYLPLDSKHSRHAFFLRLMR